MMGTKTIDEINDIHCHHHYCHKVEMPSDWITDCNFGFYYTVAIPFDDWHSIYGWNTDDNEEELSTYVYLVATPSISYGNDIVLIIDW